MDLKKIRELLESKHQEYEQEAFIVNDPISIPHSFSDKRDIEISAFFAATLAWGSRTSIIQSCRRLLAYMDYAPYQFVVGHEEKDLKPLLHFVHRTFNATDLLFFIHRLRAHYRSYSSLETAFFPSEGGTVYSALTHFHQYFFDDEHAPERTRKHISNPAKGSAAKRLNMFLRWMVRKNSPVDFGIWNCIPQSALMIPLDTHTGQVSRRLGILHRKQNDWKSVEQLTHFLRRLDPLDPIKYDYALFALGAEERINYRKRG